jgi:hypothetical protein
MLARSFRFAKISDRGSLSAALQLSSVPAPFAGRPEVAACGGRRSARNAVPRDELDGEAAHDEAGSHDKAEIKYHGVDRKHAQYGDASACRGAQYGDASACRGAMTASA